MSQTPISGQPAARVATTAAAPPATRGIDLRLALGLAAVAVLVYANSLLNGYALDDVYVIGLNDRVHDFRAWRDTWLTPYWPDYGKELGLYRPLTMYLFSLQWAAGDSAPWVFHAVNVGLHAAVTVLVFLLLGRGLPRLAAAVGALVFAVHPVHTEAVANIVGQAELLAALFLLGACLIHAARPTGVAVGWGRRAALAALFACGLLAKESAVVLPGLLVLTDLAQKRIAPSWRGIGRYAAAMAMPVFLLAATFAAYAILRVSVLEGAFMGVNAGPHLWYLKEHRLLNALRAFPEFMRLLFFPLQLSADYLPAVILPVEGMGPMVVLGLLLLVGIVALALLTPWNPAVGFPAAWFLIALAPVSNLFFPVGVVVAERTLYLPSVAVAAAAAIAWQVARQRSRERSRRLLPIALGVIVIAGAVRTWTRNPVWENTQTLMNSVIRDRPEAYKAQWVLASSFVKSDPRRAALHYEAAYRIYPDNSELLTDYAEFLLGLGQAQRAIALLESAYRFHPEVLRTASLLASAYLAGGRPQDAISMIARAEELGAPLTRTMPMRAYAFEQLGMPDRAAAAWRVALNQPDNASWRGWSYLARALALGGHDSAAIAATLRARATAPNSVVADTVARLATAVRTGCYRPTSDSPSRGTASVRACDPLQVWLGGSGLQSARELQNARGKVPAAAPGGPAGSM